MNTVNLKDIALTNEISLKSGKCPERGIVIGESPDRQNYIQVYWITGKKTDGIQRIFEMDKTFLKMKAFDTSNPVNLSLTPSYIVKHVDNIHIIADGNLTDSIYGYIEKGWAFDEALSNIAYESDKPNYTFGISGIIDLSKGVYRLAIVEVKDNTKKYSVTTFPEYKKFITGYGHCVYAHEDNNLSTCTNAVKPKLMKLYNDIDLVAEYYWKILNKSNTASLIVRFLNKDGETMNTKIMNTRTPIPLVNTSE